MHTPNDLASWFRGLYLEEVWRRVGRQSAGRPIALYGAGLHTRRLLRIVGRVPRGPHVSVILDDDPAAAGELDSLPVRLPGTVDPRSVAAVVVSTDTIQPALRDRARAWASGAAPGERPDVVPLYDDLPHGPYETIDSIVVRQHAAGSAPGRRAAVPRPIPEAAPQAVEPAPGTVAPVLDQVTLMETPDFRVHLNPLHLSIPDVFAPHQLYPVEDMRDEDFVTHAEPGLVAPHTRVSVVGSCFAVRFKRWLVRHGYNFCQFEDGPMAHVGSVRSGPLFNTGSLRQLVEWAQHGFEAEESHWPIDGWLFDPYRKAICWPDEDSARAERAAHLDAVRRMLAVSEVLIVTLGLSEVWRNRRDRRAFHLMPPPELLDPARHEHAVLSVEENVENLERFHDVVRAANPGLRLVLTLSPVPLLATYVDRHAVVSDTVSKAILRVAIDAFCRAHPDVVYFPAYEIATRMPDWPYGEDNRHVRRDPVVDRIMAAFLEHYGSYRGSGHMSGSTKPYSSAAGSRPRGEKKTRSSDRCSRCGCVSQNSSALAVGKTSP